jgi:hypothetical protein
VDGAAAAVDRRAQRPRATKRRVPAGADTPDLDCIAEIKRASARDHQELDGMVHRRVHAISCFLIDAQSQSLDEEKLVGIFFN